MPQSAGSAGGAGRDVRDDIIIVAYDLFSSDGIRAVGVNRIINTAQVAKATFYRHFRSKDDLVLAVLDRHRRRWEQTIITEAGQARSPEERLLTIFDALNEGIRRQDFRRFNYIKTLLEVGPDAPAGVAAIEGLRSVREWARQCAQEAGLRDPEPFSRSWHIIVKGSLIAAAEGDHDAAKRGRAMAALLIRSHQ